MSRILLFALLLPGSLLAQDKGGATGAQILQFNAGSRAAALSGAYVGTAADADALFYNPAAAAALRYGASLGYEAYVADVSFTSVAGVTRVGKLALGATLLHLNAGEIREVIPDPAFGGTTGVETGNTLSASETAVRVGAGLPLLDGRVRLGLSIGNVGVSVADQQQNALIADAGAQYDFGMVTVGAALRNFGGQLSGDAEDELPTELRLGASTQIVRAGGLAALFNVDVITRLRESSATLAAGIEAGLLPSATRQIGAVGRIGFDAEAHTLGAIRFGAGISLQSLAFDYAYQNLDYFGAVHRFGVRWTQLR